ncbi:hypothetical protein CVO_00745 [Sulfurimonas sp. CVO]|mgnify:CR=1 FL=1|jgi:hypothetical protein|uniref:hypothetical protein n=1 Tax=Sulfurimonas sp. CVO TaxID=2283483 RepID=UPI000CCDC431|nr:hypothetical protein [Sulfurimonas sp. CVO]PNV83358.1 MAG: hypothetical protein C0627_05930 [Sulfurimonas sp.]QHG90448.1 hypothetical protein CVO_00745 [Sulfurimonas sp. CVO]
MNEMYDMSIVTHNYSVIAVLGVIFINIFILLSMKNLTKYTRTMSLFTPIVGTVIVAIIFTGVVMMAAKHLDFTAENIIMILLAVILIYLEFKRSIKLKYLKKKENNAFENYKSYALKIFSLEIFLVLSISVWMWN